MKNLLKKAHTTTSKVAKVAKKAGQFTAITAKQVAVLPSNVSLMAMNEDKVKAYATAKVAEYATELNSIELSFDFVLGMDPNMVAAYFPETHTISFPLNLELIFMQATTLGMKWETYVDCVIAHEMGHALDPEVPSYIATLHAQKGVYNQKRYMAQNMYALELKAEELGARFAKDQKAFSYFNKANQAAYRRMIKQLKAATGVE